ncbi:MAG: type III-A CRISPR-associated RAMP protein Csm3 [Planctomycetaceae bacterium]
MRKVGHYQITGEIHNVSGLHIGGSDELLDIGAIDDTVVKDAGTMKPYIPGSSLKGKMRSRLELQFGIASGDEPLTATRREQGQGGKMRTVSKTVGELNPAEYLVATIFGPHKNTRHAFGPTRILVRDGHLLEGGRIETRAEASISRTTGTGGNPRKREQIVAGSVFRLKIDLQVLDLDEQQQEKCMFAGRKGGEAMVAFVLAGLKAVEQTGLGAGSSRGSGEVEFRKLKLDGRETWPDLSTPFELPATIPAQ